MKGLHRFTVLVACATFVLIIAGALVTSNDAGLATSDWPLSNGQVFPKMVGNLFWEHGHRMVATTVGLLTITLAVYLFLKEERRWVRRLGLFGLIAVVTQGLLGGLTVRLILGATLRHSATWDKPLPVELVIAHAGGALAVVLTLGSAGSILLHRYQGEGFLTRPAAIALLLLVVQLTLGIAAYMTRLASPNDPQPLNPMISITVAHVACGALVFATTIVLTLRTFRVVRAPRHPRELILSERSAFRRLQFPIR